MGVGMGAHDQARVAIGVGLGLRLDWVGYMAMLRGGGMRVRTTELQFSHVYGKAVPRTARVRVGAMLGLGLGLGLGLELGLGFELGLRLRVC